MLVRHIIRFPIRLHPRPSVVAATVALVAAGVAIGPSASAGASTGCGVASAKVIASQGRLVVIQATHPDPTVGSYTDIEACLGSQPPKQVDVLSSPDCTSSVREVRVTSQRYVGLDIRCSSSIGVIADTVYSFNVAQGRVWRGTQQGAVEDLRRGFVLARNGGIAYVRSDAKSTTVYGCDANAKCLSQDGTPTHRLDHVRRAATIGGLRVHGNVVSWRHGTKRRSARLA